jgi:hypothetical protein
VSLYLRLYSSHLYPLSVSDHVAWPGSTILGGWTGCCFHWPGQGVGQRVSEIKINN